MKRFLTLIACAIFFQLLTNTVKAEGPVPWQIGFQEPATGLMQEIRWFGHYTFWFIVPITLFVFCLLFYCIIRFNERVNPTPSRTSHNTYIEIIWTVLPVIILMFLAVPSFRLLTAQYSPPEEPVLTVKATGNQWNWDYEYQTPEPFSFNSSMLGEKDRTLMKKEDRQRYPRLLAVDNEIVVPVNTTTRILVTASDVIHAFAIPAFGIKVDAVPGRINETWFKPEKEGLYYGQCSELCGKDHAFMPIAVRVVSLAQYETWLQTAREDLLRANHELRKKTEE